MMERAIKSCTRPGEVVCEPFGGSGSTLIACEATGRVCCTMELQPLYCDVTVRRWQELTGQKAIHEASGELFDARQEEVSHGAAGS